MRQVTVKATLPHPATAVFDHLVDNRNDEGWCPLASNYELVEGEPGVGALYRYEQGQGPGLPKITAWLRTTVADRPTRLEWDDGGRGTPYHATMELTDLGGSTRLVHTNRVVLVNPVKQLAWFTLAQVTLRVQLRQLARVLAG